MIVTVVKDVIIDGYPEYSDKINDIFNRRVEGLSSYDSYSNGCFSLYHYLIPFSFTYHLVHSNSSFNYYKNSLKRDNPIIYNTPVPDLFIKRIIYEYLKDFYSTVPGFDELVNRIKYSVSYHSIPEDVDIYSLSYDDIISYPRYTPGYNDGYYYSFTLTVKNGINKSFPMYGFLGRNGVFYHYNKGTEYSLVALISLLREYDSIGLLDEQKIHDEFYTTFYLLKGSKLYDDVVSRISSDDIVVSEVKRYATRTLPTGGLLNEATLLTFSFVFSFIGTLITASLLSFLEGGEK